MAVTIDLTKAYLTRIHGDIKSVYTWVDGERALILVPHRREKSPIYVVMESAAPNWDDNDPATARIVPRKALHACEVLGFEPTPSRAIKIARIIAEGLGDLIRMPSAPEPGRGISFGSFVCKADGEVLGGDDVYKDKTEGVVYE